MKLKSIVAVIGLAALLVGGCGTSPTSVSLPAQSQPNAESQLTGSLKSKDGATLKGHKQTVLGLAFSPDGTTLATGSYDGAVGLCNWTTGQVTWLKGHPKGVICLAFTPDGKLVASGGWDKSVFIWDVTSTQQVASFQELPDIVTSLAFSADSKLLAVGTTDTRDDSKTMVKIFDVTGKQEKANLKGIKGRINFLAFSPDGQTLASGSSSLFLWDVSESKQKDSYYTSGTCGLGAFWPDGKIRVFTTPSSWSINKPQTAGVITLLDPETKETLAQLEGHSTKVESFALSSDRRLLASAGNEVKLWDLKEKKEIFSSAPFAAGAASVALSADGRILAAGGRDGTTKLWDVSDVAATQKKP
jgi:WD40 repeat protein